MFLIWLGEFIHIVFALVGITCFSLIGLYVLTAIVDIMEGVNNEEEV